MARYLRGAEMWRWRHVAKTQQRGGMDALRKMMHLPPLPTSVRTDLPVVRRAILLSRASQNRTNRSAEHSRQTAGPSPSKPTSQRASSGGEHT